MRTDDFDYILPPELIAQQPAQARDQARLLVLERGSGQLSHRGFADIVEYFSPNDVLVLNDSRVIPARLRGIKQPTGGQIELLLLTENTVNDWWVMLRPGKRVRAGTEIVLNSVAGEKTDICATVIDKNEEGHCRVRFDGVTNLMDVLPGLGEMPLPPYINRKIGETQGYDEERYQTIYAQTNGSVAAPTAGLHYTGAILQQLKERGVGIYFVTLHVGLGTFAPVKTERVEDHPMHEERFTLPKATADAVNRAKACGGRVFAAGTTSVRVLESAAKIIGGPLRELSGKTGIFIYPPFEFRIVDALQTNFHLPQSTLLMLVSAFASPGQGGGREMVLNAYATAIRERYRFFSYGDTMLIV